jgi:phosphopantothenoylcysteine decarboxylase/phosphopantothenate--cysteine ligase
MSEGGSVAAGRLAGRRLALGVTGSIAAYKSVELLRQLQAEGADVRVLMTEAAVAFIGTLTLETLSRHPVDTDVLALQADGKIGHIETAHDVEAIVVAPATARWLGAMANGIASDTITAACLATDVPVVVAPAMDGGMYSHPATRANVARLREFGYRIVEPEEGLLASGMTGKGRLARLDRIVEAVVDAMALAGKGGETSAAEALAIEAAELPAPEPEHQPEPEHNRRASDRPVRETPPEPRLPPDQAALAAAAAAAEEPPRPARRATDRTDLSGLHVVITAGGTAEPIDPVRFVGNRSTGKMGIAIADCALDRGAAVTVILGNASVEVPPNAHVARAETAAEMQAALRALTPPTGPLFDVLVMAAAVADFRPRNPADRKLARADGLALELESTPDLLAETADRVRIGIRSSGTARPVLVGFAAETGSFDRVRTKLETKGVDMIVANDVAEAGSGFGTDTNRVTIYSLDGPPEDFPLMTKRQVAEVLLDRIVARFDNPATKGGAPLTAPGPIPRKALTPQPAEVDE